MAGDGSAAVSMGSLSHRTRVYPSSVGEGADRIRGSRHGGSFPTDGRLRKQRSLERARDRLFALACPDGIADDDDNLSGLGELPKVVSRCAASLVVEPIAKHRRGKKLGEGPRTSGAPIEHIGRDR